MPLILRIQRYRDSPPAAPQMATFTAAGGTLGRAPGNALALEDPSKYISRTHARIDCRDGAYFITDVGSNPTLINDRPLGNGKEAQLKDGDQLVVGDYVLAAQIDGAGMDAMPEALAATAPVFVPPLFVPPPPAAPVLLPAFFDLGSHPVKPPAVAEVPPDALAGASILDVGNAGNDPFAAGADPLGLNLFGTPATPSGAYRGAESDHAAPEIQAFQMPGLNRPAMPVPAHPQQRQAPQPPAPAPAWSGGAIPDDYDPLADFFPKPAAVPPVVSIPPQPDTLSSTVPSLVSVPSAEPIAAVLPAVAAESTPAAPLEILPVSIPTPVPTPISTPLSASIPNSVFPQPVAVLVPATSEPLPPNPAKAAPIAPNSSANADDGAVLQALLKGLGMPDVKLMRTPVESAELIGAMLRGAVEGTMGVLTARAMTKRESRIEMTMMSTQANNPLKFFPDAQGALTQMLTNSWAGYLAPVKAIDDAFDDLKAHELAMMSGMRAALSGVMERFDPAAIEERLQVPTMLDKMMASNRKAKMWDRLVELYGTMSREADDDFQRLFGEKFASAYEAQVERLRRAKK